MRLRRFTDPELQVLRTMSAAGCTGIEIARALDRTPQQIRAKTCELGLRLRRQKGEYKLHTMLPGVVWAYLEPIAAARGCSVSVLVKQLLTVIARGNLVDAIIDCQPLNPSGVKKDKRYRFGRPKRQRYPLQPEETFRVHLAAFNP
jgi:hypothetical protein